MKTGQVIEMSEDLTKKAVEMLLKGATLLSEPCPYCKGVRVMKDGYALCVVCGKEPSEEKKEEIPISEKVSKSSTVEILENKLNSLSLELEKETSHEKQQEILKSINLLIETIEKLKNKQ